METVIKKVRCVDAGSWQEIKHGEVYDVVQEDGEFYTLAGEYTGGFYKTRFEDVIEAPAVEHWACRCPHDGKDCIEIACGDGSGCEQRKEAMFRQQEDTRNAQAIRALDAIERKDNVRRPEHYSRWKIEPIEFIMANELDFETGNVIKYVMRSPFKNGVEDWKKARRYCDMKIKKLEGDPNFAK